jgi:hypothetical protein
MAAVKRGAGSALGDEQWRPYRNQDVSSCPKTHPPPPFPADPYDCSTRRLSGACEGQRVGGEGGGVGVGVGVGVGLGEAERLGTLLWSNKM